MPPWERYQQPPQSERAAPWRRYAAAEQPVNVDSGKTDKGQRIGVAEDVGRSFVAGGQRGAAGIAGSQGELRNMGRQALSTIVRGIGSVAGRDYTDEEANSLAGVVQSVIGLGNPLVALQNAAPDSQDALRAIEHYAGPIHEPQTTAGEYARTVGEFVPNAVVPGGVATRVARVVAPAVASEAAGQMTAGTDAEPWARIAGALAGGGVTEGFMMALTRGGRTPDERALRLIQRELNDQGQSTDDIVRQANVLLRQAPTEEVIAETLGPGGLRLARALANLGRGAGRAEAERALNVRADGGRAPSPTPSSPNQTRAVTSIRDRMMGEAARMTAPQQTHSPRDYWDALDALRAARSGQGADAYRAMYAATPDPEAVQSQLLPYLADAPQEAAQSGVRQLRSVADGLRARLAAAGQRGQSEESIAAMRNELDDVVTSMRQLEGVASGQMPNTLTSRSVDYYQRGLAQMERGAGLGSPEARALGDARRAFNDMADEIVPGFRDARSRYGDSMRIEEYMNDGRRVFEMSDGEIDRLLRGQSGRGLSVEEFDGFMLGAMDAIERKLGQSDTGFLARMMRNKNWRDQLTTAMGGEAQTRRFFDRLAREANMQQTRNHVLSGSRTAGLQDDIAALTTGESELAFLNDNARQLIASGGNVRPLVIRWVLSMHDRFNRPGLRNPEVQEAMARRIFARVTRNSSRELRDALNALDQDQVLGADAQAWLRRMMMAANATAGERVEGDESAASDETDTRWATDSYLGSRQAAQGDQPIDVSRPILENKDGSFSTEETITIEENGRFYNIPTIINGERVDEAVAVAAWRRGMNQAVGEFGSLQEAEAAARARSEQIGRVRAPERR